MFRERALDDEGRKSPVFRRKTPAALRQREYKSPATALAKSRVRRRKGCVGHCRDERKVRLRSATR